MINSYANANPHKFTLSFLNECKYSWITRKIWLISGLSLSIFTARAEAPPLSQEFWNYLVEYGNTQGELFDPSDYDAVINLSPKAVVDMKHEINDPNHTEHKQAQTSAVEGSPE